MSPRSVSRSPSPSLSPRRSPSKSPPPQSVSRSPARPASRRNRRSFSRSPVRTRSPVRKAPTPSNHRRSPSRSASLDGSPKRIRRGRGFSERYSYARRYRTPSPPDRSPVRYRYRAQERDRYIDKMICSSIFLWNGFLVIYSFLLSSGILIIGVTLTDHLQDGIEVHQEAERLPGLSHSPLFSIITLKL